MRHFLLLLCVLISSLNIHATIWQKFKIDNLNYQVTSESETSMTGTVTVWNGGVSGDLVIPATVSYNGFTYTVNEINGEYYIDGEGEIEDQDSEAFYGANISSVSFPNTIEIIGSYAFENCSGLTNVNIPSSVTNIKNGAFSSCSNLTSITVDATNTVYDSRENCNAIIETATNKLIQGCSSSIIPNSVTAIGNAAFAQCSNLTSINIPNGVKSIGSSAFANCKIPSIVIPESVESIGQHAFGGNSILTSLVVKWDTPIKLTTDIIVSSNYNRVTLNVPLGTKSKYKSANIWRKFTNINEYNLREYSDFNDGTFNYIITSNNNNTRTVAVAAINENLSGNVIIPAEVEYNGVTYTVTKILQYGFANCNQMTTITIPTSVESIDKNAFSLCTALTEIKTAWDYTNVAYINSVIEYQYRKNIKVEVPDYTTYLAYNKKGWSQFNLVKLSDVGNYLVDNYLLYQITSEDAQTNTGTAKLLSYQRRGFESTQDWMYDDIVLEWYWNNSNIYDDWNGETVNPSNLYANTHTQWTNLVIPETISNNGFVYTVNELTENCLANPKKNMYNDGTFNGPVSITIPATVVKIGEKAFSSLPKLETVQFLGNTIVELGKSIFNNSTVVNVVFNSSTQTLPESTFSNCKKLTTVTCPNLENISKWAFHSCNELTSLDTDNLVYIGYEAFRKALKTNSQFTIASDRLETIDTLAFYENNAKEIKLNHIKEIKCAGFFRYTGKLWIPESIEIIGDMAFNSWVDNNDISFAQEGQEMNVLNFPNLMDVGRYAFNHCGNPQKVILSNPNLTLKMAAFQRCVGLKELSLPNTLTTIPDRCFLECNNLEKVGLPENLETIGYWAFAKCDKLDDINWPESLETISDGAFYYCELLDDVDISNVSYIQPNDDIVYIDRYPTFSVDNTNYGSNTEPLSCVGAFAYCTKLKNITLSEELQNLPARTFEHCTSLEYMLVPSKVQYIGDYAFSWCENLRIVKISNSVKTIGKEAFSYIKVNKHITLPSHLTNLDDDIIFASMNNGTKVIEELTLPQGVNSLNHLSRNGITPQLGLYIIGDKIPENLSDFIVNDYDETFDYQLTPNYPADTYKYGIYVKRSVFNDKYPDGKFMHHHVSYQVPVRMCGTSGVGVEYKTLCRDFDVDLTHTNDNLPDGVEPLRAYVVEEVDGDLRMVFLNEIKYIPSRLKANVTDENGNLYQGVDEYVGVILRGTPGYTYFYEIGEHDYTQGAEGQWSMEDAMAYSGRLFENNMMSGDANDEFYVHKTVLDNEGNEIVNYGLNNNRLKIYNKDGWLNYNKAYLQLSKDVSEAIEGNTDAEGNVNLTFMFNNSDGSTDKISSVEFMKNAESDIFYNPYGQRVSKDTKGIVINNGKKFVNK